LTSRPSATSRPPPAARPFRASISAAVKAEIEEWQALGAESVEMFPFEDEQQK
jgi:hypothetical protein